MNGERRVLIAGRTGCNAVGNLARVTGDSRDVLDPEPAGSISFAVSQTVEDAACVHIRLSSRSGRAAGWTKT